MWRLLVCCKRHPLTEKRSHAPECCRGQLQVGACTAASSWAVGLHAQQGTACVHGQQANFSMLDMAWCMASYSRVQWLRAGVHGGQRSTIWPRAQQVRRQDQMKLPTWKALSVLCDGLEQLQCALTTKQQTTNKQQQHCPSAVLCRLCQQRLAFKGRGVGDPWGCNCPPPA